MQYPDSFSDFWELIKDLVFISPLSTIIFFLIFGLWVAMNIVVAHRAGYPRFFGIAAVFFPPLYLIFAFSMWPAQEKLIYVSGARWRQNPNAVIAPNYKGKTKR